MRAPLVLAVAQPSCVPYDVVANAAAHAAAIRSAGARVVVFPELSLTGYELDAPAVSAGDPRLAPIVDACADAGSLALVGAPVEGDGGAASIGVLAIDGTGARVAYRKIHVHTSEERFAAGPAPVALEIDGHRLGLAVCRDMAIPAHAADTAALGIDVYVAGVLDTAADAATQDAHARRIAADHGVFVAIASFAGSTGGGFDHAAGRSAIWAPDGTELARAGAEPGAVVVATLS